MERKFISLLSDNEIVFKENGTGRDTISLLKEKKMRREFFSTRTKVMRIIHTEAGGWSGCGLKENQLTGS